MEMTVHRTKNGEKACIGWLDINGQFECYTLEDVIRNLGPNGEGKIKDETGIPAGEYKVSITWSDRFQRDMPLIENVPFFTGIRIHSGNTMANTSGCLLVGKEQIGDDYIKGGLIEAPALQAKIQAALDAKEDVWIEFRNEFPDDSQVPLPFEETNI